MQMSVTPVEPQNTKSNRPFSKLIC